MRKRILSMLALLCMAVTSAWADATIAKLWVGNSEEVTSEGIITGTGATEGTASVAIENGSMVLTLNNFKFIGCGYNDSGIYYQSNANGDTPLIIKIEGNNEITLPGDAVKSLYGFFLYGGNGDHVFTITGSGSLTVTVGDGNLSNGIFVQQADLVLAGGTVTANAGSAGAEFKSLGVSVPQGTLTIDGCTLKASGSTTSASRGVNVEKNVTIKSGELEAYGYSKGIKNSDGGDALVFAEGVTPTLFKAGDNEASATDVSKYEGQKYLHVVCTGGDEPAAPTGDGAFTLSVGTSEHGTVTFKVGENTVTTAQEGQTVTVEITPATGWVVNQPTGQWYAAIAAGRSQAPIDLLTGITLTPVQGQDNQWTFTMKRANAEISATYKKLLTNTDITVTVNDVTYSGVAQTPTVTVKDGENELVKDQDYTVSFSNNTGGGTGIVTITGIGDNYAGETTAEFTINPAQGMVYIYPMDFEKVYGDENFTITPSIVTGDGMLIYMSENESVAMVDENTGEVTIVGVGKATIKAILCATANYTSASDFYNLTVKPKEIAYEDGTVTQDQNGYTVALTEDPNSPNAQPLPNDADLAKLSYSRTLTAPGTSEGDKTIDGQAANLFTVCLPFAPKTDNAAKYYTLSGVSGTTIYFDEVTTPAANTPYLVAVFGSVNFTEKCTNLEVASIAIHSTTVDGYTFTGTFTGLTNAQAVGKYILQKGNTWGKVTTENPDAYIPPFRAYVEGPANGARQLTGCIGGEATGIQNIRTVDQDGTERWYDLSGKRIIPKKGINILNGKKVVVR